MTQLERQFVDYTGIASLLRLHEDVADELELSDKQVEQIRNIETDIVQKMNEVYRKARQEIDKEGKRDPLRAKHELDRRILKFRQTEERNKILNVLTENQKQRWTAMLGVLFDVSRLVDRGNTQR